MDATTQLWYIRSSSRYEEEKPYHIFERLPEGCPPSNLVYERGRQQTITDVRGRQGEFTLDTHGFTFRNVVPPALNWNNETEIEANYISYAKEVLVGMLGIGSKLKACEVFDWRMRKGGSTNLLENPSGDRMVKITPALIVHIDQSPAGVLDRVQRQFGPDAENLIRDRRVQIFNIWKPLVDVVEDLPLAFCDARTVCPTDLMECEFVNADYVRRSYMVKYSESFRFYYLSRMTKNEICVFKVFDSADVEAKHVPHAAFEHKTSTSAVPRESIEVRLLVVSEA